MPKTAFRHQPGVARDCIAIRGSRPITKLLLRMKLTIVLLTTMLTCTFAAGVSQTVTYSGKDIPLKQVITAIESQTGYVVFSNRSTLEEAKPVTISASNMPLAEFMQALLKDQPFEFIIEGKNIVLSPKKTVPAPIILFEQKGYELKGLVFDEKTYAPVRGVSVSVNGTSKATQTDEKGAFSFKGIEGDVTLSFTCIGYTKKIVKVPDNSPQLTVTLSTATNELDVAVVQAYGITSKRLATGNITKVTGEEIRRLPAMNPMLALEGRVPGLVVSPLSGNSSSPVKLLIRGRNSINPLAITEPLVVIDGIPQTVLESGKQTFNPHGVSQGFTQGGPTVTRGQSPYFSINPHDIESIEVLKDADATAIYGSRAANGVILITTKKAKPGKTSLDFDIQQGLMVTPRAPQMLSLREYLDIRYEALQNDGITPTAETAPDLVLWDTTRSTDWIKELLSSGKRTDLFANLSGGDNRTSFRLGAGYTTQTDLSQRSGGNERGTVQLSTTHKSSNQKLTIGMMVSLAVSKVDAIADPATGFMSPPNAPSIFDKAGNLNFAEWGGRPDQRLYPFSYILQPNVQKTNALSGSLQLGYTLIKGLELSGSLSYQNMNNSNDYFVPMASQNPKGFRFASSSFGTTKNTSLAFEPRLNYSRAISKGQLTVLAGATAQTTKTATSVISAIGFPSDDLMRNIANAPRSGVTATNTGFDYKYAALYARIKYEWDQRIMVNLQGRRDGSSRFAPGSQFGNFGSIGIGWNVSEEEWIKNNIPSWISFVQLRGSYGITGSDNVGNYEYLPRYSNVSPTSNQTMYSYNGVQPYVSVIPVNQQYRWESNHKLEGSLSMSFLENKINVGASFYRQRSGNQLTKLPTPNYTGFEYVNANWMATVQNSGIELQMDATLIRKKELSLRVAFNVGKNKNKLIRYPGIENSPYATMYRVGTSTALVYLLRLTGVDPLTGYYSFEDYNNDGVVTSSTAVLPGTANDDRYVYYDINPKFSGGFSADLTWKNLSLNCAFTYSNEMGLMPDMGVNPGQMLNIILPADMKDNHWRKPGDITKYGKYTTMSNSRTAFTNTSFLSMRSCNISYAIPEKLSKSAGLKNCRFAVAISNLFTISKYQLDPQIKNGSFVPLARGINASLHFTL